MPISLESADQDAAPIPKLNLYSVEKLAGNLGFSADQLCKIASVAGSFYNPFDKKERHRPFQKRFKPPKKHPRIIDNPGGNLKVLQQRINERLLKPIVFPHYLCGGVPGKSTLDNVRIHLGAPELITIDIKNFFRRITNLQIYEVWAKTLGCSGAVAALLTRVTTFERHLPQGAPTSTLLANLVINSVDQSIRTECARRHVNYSTWVDDLAFSGAEAREILKTAIASLSAAGFAVPHAKQKRMGPGTRKVLNGVLMDRFPNVLPEVISRLRSGIHKLATGQVAAEESDRYVRQLKGRIAHVASIAPRKAAKLTTGLNEALPIHTAPRIDRARRPPETNDSAERPTASIAPVIASRLA